MQLSRRTLARYRYRCRRPSLLLLLLLQLPIGGTQLRRERNGRTSERASVRPSPPRARKLCGRTLSSCAVRSFDMYCMYCMYGTNVCAVPIGSQCFFSCPSNLTRVESHPLPANRHKASGLVACTGTGSVHLHLSSLPPLQKRPKGTDSGAP